MALDANNRLSFVTGGAYVRSLAFRYQFSKEKRKRDKDLTDGVSRNELNPFSPALVAAAVNKGMLKKAEVDDKYIEEFTKWQSSAITDSYGGDDPEATKRYLSNLIDKAYSSSPWWKIIKNNDEKNKQTRVAYEDYVYAPQSPKALLMDFAWYYENLQTAEDQHVQGLMKAKDEKNEKYPLVTAYPDTFIARLKSNTLRDFGASEEEIKTFSEAPFSSVKEQKSAIEKLMVPLCNRNGLDLTDVCNKESGDIKLKSIFPTKPEHDESEEDFNNRISRLRNYDGEIVDFVAAMKHFRNVKQSWSVVAGIAYKSGVSVTEAINRGYASKSAVLSDDFVNLAVNKPYSKDFLEEIGVSESQIKSILGNKGKPITEKVRGAVLFGIGGKKKTEKNKEGEPTVLSAIKIQFEFSNRGSEITKFMESFKAQNEARMKARREGRQMPSFSDDILIKAYNREWLEKIGLPEANIDAILKFRMDPNNLNDYARQNFSNMIAGGKNGLHNAEAKKGKRIHVDKDSSLPDIYKAIKQASGDCYAASQRISAEDRYTYIYPDGLLEALFRTDILEDIRKTHKGAGNRIITEEWLRALPDDYLFFNDEQLGRRKEDEPQIYGGFDRDRLIAALDIKNEDASTKADYIVKVFSMLVMSNYHKGDTSYWKGTGKEGEKPLNLGQRTTFARVINKEILSLFKSYTMLNESNKKAMGEDEEEAKARKQKYGGYGSKSYRN